MNRELSRQGAALTASFEAIYMFTYPDPGTGGEPWTAGIGHTAAAGGIAPRPGQLFSMMQIMDIYRSDMGRVVDRVNRAIKVEIGQPQFDVAVSFDLNTGAISSGTFDDKLNAGQVEAALVTFAQYTKAGGHFMQGLANRRAIEIAVFRTGVYPNRKILVYDRPGAAIRFISPDALPWEKGPDPEIILTPKPLPDIPLPVKGRENFLIDIGRAIWSWFK